MKFPNLIFSKRPFVFLITSFVFIILTFQINFGQLVESKSNSAALSSNSQNKNDIDFDLNSDFRIEKMPVKGGAEIITVFAKLKGVKRSPDEPAKEIPLVSVLRDTLGDEIVENDSLRYLWMLTYTRPSFVQRASAIVPFLYMRTQNKRSVGNKPPPPVIDLEPTDKQMWNRIFWLAFRGLILNDISSIARTPTLHYRDNVRNYQQTAIVRALALISLYEAANNEKILSDVEMREIQARLTISDSFFAPLMQKENLERIYSKEITLSRDIIGQNWELLRQTTESQGLIFDPLGMPDGKTTHALVWTTEEDIAANKNKKYDGRFLNFKNPWKDQNLTKWKGYKEVRWYDAENRQVAPDTPGAKKQTLIPLGLYGLDFPKIPALLVDFRNTTNPKKREMSRRVLQDLTRALAISRFGNLPVFVGRFVYEYVTARRGMDYNQRSRFESYAQLKLLLSLNASLDPEFRNEISKRLESVSLNPLENNLEVEIKIAEKQYANLMEYAKRDNGLPAQIDKDRREEMVYINHGGKKRLLYAFGNYATFGLYTHREKSTPELMAKLDLRRQLIFHERVLREISVSSAQLEMDNDLETVRKSVKFIAENGLQAGDKTAAAIHKIFMLTLDKEIKNLCIESLFTIDRAAAKKELLALYQNSQNDAHWRELSFEYLKRALKEEQKFRPLDREIVARLSEK